MTKSQNETNTLVDLSFPKMYKVIIHNDDTTPIELVIFILTECVEIDKATALHKASEAHETGSAVVGVFTKAKAEEIIANSVSTATLNGFPEFTLTHEEE